MDQLLNVNNEYAGYWADACFCLLLNVFTAELKWLPEWLEYSVDVDQLVHCTAWQAVADAPRFWIAKNWNSLSVLLIVPVARANQ